MKKQLFMLAVSLTLLLVSATWTFAQRGPGGRGGAGFLGPMGPAFGGPQMHRVLRQLDLSDDQRAEIQALTTASRTELREIMVQFRETHQLLREALEAGTYNGELDEEIGSLFAQQMAVQVRLRQRIYESLTAEQQAQLDELEEKARTRRGGPFSRGN